ncbi:Gellan lyase [Pontiella desulfatans]|uniref:Gellan lyase n=1 Tax=Pontiella desulfatans TaxID=2750659 RepID=A0A6C2U2N2_PONDE|nr:DNRLRE domain-containing protein [Pontiella desulfatans]VGO13914.1 Gellan lyase [Pontiella desulfatans]
MRSLLIRSVLFGLLLSAAGALRAETVGYWRFEQGAVTNDSSGNGLDLGQTGTRISGVSRPASGPGSMLSTIPLGGETNDGVSLLNGKGDQWSVADDALLDFSASGFTFEAFVTPVLSNGWTVVAIKAEEWRVTIGEDTGKLQFSLNNGSGGWVSRSFVPNGTDSFAGGKDYYVGVSVGPDGSAAFYYQDLTEGTLFSSTADFNVSVTNLTSDLRLNGSAANQALLYMDEVRLSSGVVSASDLLPVKGALVTDFRVDGADTSSIDLTWSNLAGSVVVESSTTSLPLIDSVQDSFLDSEGVSGIIKLNLQAVDDSASRFNPFTWRGGGQSAGNVVHTMSGQGWGVQTSAKTNGDIQDSEALILTFDLSELSLGADQTLVLSAIDLFNDVDAYSGDIWMRNHDVPAGTAGAGMMLANNVVTFSDPMPIRDGDQIALMKGSTPVRLGTLKFDILPAGFNVPHISFALDSGNMVVGATNLSADAYVTVQQRESLTSGAWSDVAVTSGVSLAEWTFPMTNAAGFFRAGSSDTYPVPRFGYLFKPVDDSFVSGENTTSNYGSNTNLSLRTAGTGQKLFSYLKFDVDEVPSSISEVWLKVYAAQAVSNTVWVRVVDDNAWDESTITWANRPVPGDIIKSKDSFSKGWNTFDLSGHITSTGTYSLALMTSDPDEQVLMSKESAYDPVLEIRETPDGPEKPVGLFAGGSMYGSYGNNAAEVKSSGFDTLLLWSAKVKTSGEIYYNLSENELTQYGSYIGEKDWIEQLLDLKTAPSTVKRIEFSVSAWGDASFANIDALIEAEGTGEDSRLYQSFKVLRDVLGADAINFDDEEHYDVDSMVEFSKMLSVLGYKVTLCPYMRPEGVWNPVYEQLEAYQPGLCDRIYVQCYAGGAANYPEDWNTKFDGDLKVIPGLSINPDDAGGKTPAEVEAQLSEWKDHCGGGFIWLHQQILNQGYGVSNVANAVINGLE